MRYIERLPVKTIAQRLNTTERNVMWHLHDAREKIKKDVKNMSNQTDFKYRPRKFRIGITGDPGPNCDAFKLNEILTAQNICLVCSEAPRNIDEIADLLGFPKAYLENDLQWLEQKEFIKKKGSRYSTDFFVKTIEFQAKIIQLFMEHRATYSDKIIEQLLAREKEIKAIGFHGSDKPMKKLLWFLIYSYFMHTWAKNTDQINIEDCPHRTDGGKYIPTCWELPNQNTIEVLRYAYGAKYRDMTNWCTNGPITLNSPQTSWVGVFNVLENKRANTSLTKLLLDLYDSKYIKVLKKSLKKDFNLNTLNEDERVILSEIIGYGWMKPTFPSKLEGLGVVEECSYIPNFLVFTSQQAQNIGKIYEDIYQEMKPEIEIIQSEIAKLCKTNLPKLPDFIFRYAKSNSEGIAQDITYGIAYYDDILYKPKNEDECELLTLQMVIDG
jgi:hypothetical protein